MNAKTSVAIIGAGISGLAAAIGAAAHGAKVSLYDSNNYVMHLQRGTETRFLHPNISRWPEKTFGYPISELPYFNWRSETAGNVIAQLDKQWQTAKSVFKNNIDLSFLGSRVEEIEYSEGSRLIVKTASEKNQFELIILAVGYGLEKSKPSYWRNDDLAQPVLFQENASKKVFFVAGAGDGGLTECLRLTIKDFQHQQFIQAIMRDASLIGQSQKLSTDKQWKIFLHKKESQEVPRFLNLVRSDTKVYLNARSPFEESKSQALHKICVALIMKHFPELIEYVQGDLVEPKTEYIKRLSVREAEKVKHYTVDELVDRRGTLPILERLFPKETSLPETLKKKWKGTDISHEPKYGVGFLSDRFKRCHLESSYQIGFIFRSPNQKQELLNKIIANLQFEMPVAINEWLNSEGVGRSPSIEILGRGRVVFDITELSIIDFFGDDPQNYEITDSSAPSTFWRIFASSSELNRYTRISTQSTPCLLFSTRSRFIVEKLLEADSIRYNLYKVYLANTVEDYLLQNFPEKRPDRFVNLDTKRFLISRDDLPVPKKYFEIHSVEGMLTAHLLLRATTMLEILMNQWSTSAVHGMGWAIGHSRNYLKEEQIGNKLLEWNPS